MRGFSGAKLQRRQNAYLHGEVGILFDEHLQRLIAILAEAAEHTLDKLLSIVAERKAGELEAHNLYRRGLASISSWPMDVVRAEVTRLSNTYVEFPKLVDYAYFLTLSEMGEGDLASARVPDTANFFHSFMKRWSGVPDVQRDRAFVALPYGEKRCVVADSLRQCLHDLVQSSPKLLRPQPTGKSVEGSVASTSRRADETSTLQRAVGREREREGGESEKEATRELSPSRAESPGPKEKEEKRDKEVTLNGPCFFSDAA